MSLFVSGEGTNFSLNLSPEFKIKKYDKIIIELSKLKFDQVNSQNAVTHLIKYAEMLKDDEKNGKDVEDEFEMFLEDVNRIQEKALASSISEKENIRPKVNQKKGFHKIFTKKKILIEVKG